MHRLLVVLLAALDAVIAAAGGVAVVLAPLTLLWVVGFGSGADWATLWPASGAIWQLGHLVPLDLTLPAEYLNIAGIDPTAASFTLSLAPLALAVFTALFAARSGRRAAQAGAPATGAVTGVVVFTAIAAVVALTTANALATVELWQAVLFPALVFGLPAVLGAFVESWRLDEHGSIARLRSRIEHGTWGALPGLLVRGTAISVTGLIGVAAAIAGAAVLLRGGEIVALFEAAHVDAAGVIVLALAQLAYLPTLIVWALSFVAGPGFALGEGTAVSPAGTQLGVLPGIPVLGVVPESSTTWLLLLALLPVSVGVLTGWMLRSRLAAMPHAARDHDGGLLFRLVLAVSVAVVTGALAALLAVLGSGSIGPGRLARIGPDAGALAFTVGVEVLVGAAILLLLPRRASDDERREVAASVVPARPALPDPGLDTWRRLAAERPFSHPERPVPTTDTWQAPPTESAEPTIVGDRADPRPVSVDSDATEPIPGFERGGASDGDERPRRPSVD
ncbi:DUF6350 family protein [Microbacterium hatanonis]|uniref:cell division protein PerM n=1 Tax=Microbacterium hatanonis TaxID=404366 RepID=UPI00164FDCDC|nr:DUF6350 family protein [Microbacterium hatanonis]